MVKCAICEKELTLRDYDNNENKRLCLSCYKNFINNPEIRKGYYCKSYAEKKGIKINFQEDFEAKIKKDRIDKINKLKDTFIKKNAWTILENYGDKYGDNPLDNYEKLNKLLNNKYDIDLDKDVLLELIEFTKLKEKSEKRNEIKEMEEFEKELLENKKFNDRDEKRLFEIGKKIKKWKNDGYNVEELEKLVKINE